MKTKLLSLPKAITVFYFISKFPFLFCVLLGASALNVACSFPVDGMRHALRSEWPFIIISIKSQHFLINAKKTLPIYLKCILKSNGWPSCSRIGGGRGWCCQWRGEDWRCAPRCAVCRHPSWNSDVKALTQVCRYPSWTSDVKAGNVMKC